MRRLLTFVITAATAALLASQTIASSSHSAGVSCSTDTAAEVAAATATNRGYNWSSASQPNPLWSFDFPDLHASVDLYAPADLASAQTAAKAWLDAQVAGLNCNSAPSGGSSGSSGSGSTSSGGDSGSSSSSAPAADPNTNYANQAAAIAAAASVVNRGYNWSSASQPNPLWTVSVSSLSMSVDVYAVDEAGARSAAIPTIEAALAHSGATPDAPAQQSSPSSSPPASAPSTPSSGSTSSPDAPATPVSTSSSGSLYAVTVIPADAQTGTSQPAQFGTNKILAGALSAAMNVRATFTTKSVCLIGAKVVPCWKVWPLVQKGASASVLATTAFSSGLLVIKRLTIQH